MITVPVLLVIILLAIIMIITITVHGGPHYGQLTVSSPLYCHPRNTLLRSNHLHHHCAPDYTCCTPM